MSESLPQIPGDPVDSRREIILKQRVKELTGTNAFPGAQPVSFTNESLQELEKEDYFLTEKSDGIRVLVYATTSPNGKPETYLIDRKNVYRIVKYLRFPVEKDIYHKDSLFDAELVMDKENDGRFKLTLLAFDLLYCNGMDMRSRPLTNRLGYLTEKILKPYHKYIRENPLIADKQPFWIEMKHFELAYGITKVLEEMIPKLAHKSDGLIFTSVNAPYHSGTNDKMIKYKEPQENSIDFELRVVSNGAKKPHLQLWKWLGSRQFDYFADLGLTDDEWERLQPIGNLDRKIVEVVYDPGRDTNAPWRLLRFRDDKKHPNHNSTVDKILVSIRDAVEIEKLTGHQDRIRDAWKARVTRKENRQREEKREHIYKHKVPSSTVCPSSQPISETQHDNDEQQYQQRQTRYQDKHRPTSTSSVSTDDPLLLSQRPPATQSQKPTPPHRKTALNSVPSS